jgi:hypothetical protein
MFKVFIITCSIIGTIGGFANLYADRIGLGIFGLSCAVIALLMLFASQYLDRS